MASSRSEFLKQAAGAAVAVGGAAVGAGALAAPAEAALFNPKEYLMLDGVNVGRVVSASGGDPTFEVEIVGYDSDGNPDKQIKMGPPRRLVNSSFRVSIGAGMGKGMYDWISASMIDPTVRKNGAVIAADFNQKEQARRSFTNALITEITIPRLVNKPQAFPAITVTFSVDSAADETPSSTPVVGAKQKAWLTSNFKFELGSLPPSATGVASTDSFTWRRTPATAGTPTQIDCDDLNLSIGPAGRAAWEQWYNNFALGGDTSDERDAVLTVWGSTPQDPLFTCTFGGLGIHTFIPASVIKRTTVEVYVEKMTWDLG